MAEELDDSFDLVINTLSMSEMTEHQVLKYAHLMRRRWLKPDGSPETSCPAGTVDPNGDVVSGPLAANAEMTTSAAMSGMCE